MDGSPLRAIASLLDGHNFDWKAHVQDGGYGLAVGVAGPRGSVVPSAVLGFPNPADIRAQAPPVKTPAFVRYVMMGPCFGLRDYPWINRLSLDLHAGEEWWSFSGTCVGRR